MSAAMNQMVLPKNAEEEELLALYRQVRGSYVAICRVLVVRGVLAEMPRDLEKPIKVHG